MPLRKLSHKNGCSLPYIEWFLYSFHGHENYIIYLLQRIGFNTNDLIAKHDGKRFFSIIVLWKYIHCYCTVRQLSSDDMVSLCTQCIYRESCGQELSSADRLLCSKRCFHYLWLVCRSRRISCICNIPSERISCTYDITDIVCTADIFQYNYALHLVRNNNQWNQCEWSPKGIP